MGRNGPTRNEGEKQCLKEDAKSYGDMCGERLAVAGYLELSNKQRLS